MVCRKEEYERKMEGDDGIFVPTLDGCDSV